MDDEAQTEHIKENEEQSLIMQKLKAIKYPENKFLINLPSLKAAAKVERRLVKQSILKQPGMVKQLDSARRR